jgi:hypothetical protein
LREHPAQTDTERLGLCEGFLCHPAVKGKFIGKEQTHLERAEQWKIKGHPTQKGSLDFRQPAVCHLTVDTMSLAMSRTLTNWLYLLITAMCCLTTETCFEKLITQHFLHCVNIMDGIA